MYDHDDMGMDMGMRMGMGGKKNPPAQSARRPRRPARLLASLPAPLLPSSWLLCAVSKACGALRGCEGCETGPTKQPSNSRPLLAQSEPAVRSAVAGDVHGGRQRAAATRLPPACPSRKLAAGRHCCWCCCPRFSRGSFSLILSVLCYRDSDGPGHCRNDCSAEGSH